MCIFIVSIKASFPNVVSVENTRDYTHFSTKMPKNLYKVQKHISKKKGKLGTLHEGSRDSKRLQAAGGREEKLARAAAVTNKGRLGYGEWMVDCFRGELC